MLSVFKDHPGEWLALCVAIFWTVTALAFESASIKTGSLSVNILRLVIGFFFLSISTLIFRNHLLPTDASSRQWLWLSISGFIGFFLGDLFLFKSYTIIGSRFAMLIMALAPPLAAIFGKFILDESIRSWGILGMLVTLLGISIAILSRKGPEKKLSLKLAPRGLFFALAGATGQGLGLVISKAGMAGYNPFAATQIRIIAGIVGFSLLITWMRRWNKVVSSAKNLSALKDISAGAFFGPFLGVSFSLWSIQYTETGIAATIMAIIPVLIIPPALLIYKQKVTLSEVIGAVISIAGLSIFFIL